MKLVVGLGNPGGEYAFTRHNVGFMVIDELAKRHAITNWRSKHEALAAEIRADEPILLVKPQTFMNLSGNAVGAIARWYKVAPEDIIVIVDDMDLAPGRLRLRTRGSSGGHRGLESILVNLGQEDFIRVRVGIGRPRPGQEVVNYVLNGFSQEEKLLLDKAIVQAADAVEYMLKHDMASAMNRYNK